MNCSHFASVVFAVARDQLLDVTAREQALTHTRICVKCASRLAEERALFEGVRSVVAELAKQEAPANVEAALLAVFREHVAQTPSPTMVVMPIRSLRRRIWRLAAVAAAILVLISGMAALWQRSSPPNPREEAVLPPPPQVPQGESAPHREIISTNKAIPPRPSRSTRRASRSNLSEVEVMTEFFPLVDGGGGDSLENSQIVRVELPSSALIAVGLPVGVASAGEVVEADVVLGHDGLARAIRFVR